MANGRVQRINYSELSDWKRIAAGTFGTVYRVKWNNEIVAAKELNSTDHEAIVKEVEQLCCVTSHDNIIKFFGISKHFEDFIESTWLILEYADCGSLYDFLHKPPRRPYTAAHALNWLRQCAAGMNHLHTQQGKTIVHRDLKPANLLLFNNFTTLKIGDFGTVAELRTLMTSKTGSPLWMAPEVFRGNEYTEKCDVYSWGIMLWEVICRKMPYREFRNEIELLKAVVAGTRPPRIERCPKVLTDLMESCWDPEPSKRPSMIEIHGIITDICSPFEGASAPINENQTAPEDNMQTVIQVIHDTLTRI